MKIADAVEIGNKADLNELESPGLYRVNDEQKFTYKQTQEIFVEALNSNAYLNMCECSDMINAIKALEKQIPKKPELQPCEEADISTTLSRCPVCGEIVEMEYNAYCGSCGQKLDWSDEG